MSDIRARRREITVLGLSGLFNIGNTCYMNSAIQCVMASSLLTLYFKKKKFELDLYNNIEDELADIERKKLGLTDEDTVELKKTDVKNTISKSITYNYYQLVKTYWEENSIIRPDSLKHAIGLKNNIFRGFHQQDSQELLSFLLDSIHEETKIKTVVKSFTGVPEYVSEYSNIKSSLEKRLEDDCSDTEKEEIKTQLLNLRRENLQSDLILKYLHSWSRYIKKFGHSIITLLYTGMFVTHIDCLSCGAKFSTFDPFTLTPVHIPDDGDTTLEDCFREFTKPETLEENSYNCEACNNKVTATRQTTIWKAPENLIIQLKRFKNNGFNLSKVSSKVSFPLEGLSLDTVSSEYYKNKSTYDLYAIIQHSGSLYGGHYIAYTKNKINNEWYLYDDSNVLHIPKERLESEIVTRGSYILFYNKVHSSTAPEAPKTSEE